MNCQKILCINCTRVPTDKNELQLSNLEFFVYTFSEKETAIIPLLPNTNDASFGFNLKNCELSGYTYVQDVDNTVSFSVAKSFETCKWSQKKLNGAFITHINGYTFFSTAQAYDKLKQIYEQFIKAKDEGVAKDSLFKIIFAPVDKLKGKQLKREIDDHHVLLPGTSKQIK